MLTQQEDYIEGIMQAEEGVEIINLFSATLEGDTLTLQALEVTSDEQAFVLCDGVANVIYQMAGRNEENVGVALEIIERILKTKFEEEGDV